MEKSSGKLMEFPTEGTKDVLREVLRKGAQQMLATAIETEVEAYLSRREHFVDKEGHQVVVRNGHLPGRKLQTPLGEVPLKQPRVRDHRPEPSGAGAPGSNTRQRPCWQSLQP